MDEITNTANDEGSKIEVLASGMLGGQAAASSAIMAQEKRGQEELLASEMLPSDLNGHAMAEFEELGFTFDLNHQDPLFMKATMPKGWTREGSSHSMWSYLLDERGIRRVGVFYKAAFYDRKAHMQIINVGRDFVSRYLYEEPRQPWSTIYTEPERLQAMAAVEAIIDNSLYDEEIKNKARKLKEQLTTAIKDIEK